MLFTTPQTRIHTHTHTHTHTHAYTHTRTHAPYVRPPRPETGPCRGGLTIK